ncbi:hypothetical protein [Erythrobacter sp. WG]|uniref:hypothetical protein n=1 Tax=Erythrobacter sp. WG TaxID=2985510 RepID=UPI00226F2C8E|nr:hypothetical protein [Erythrobacter sp. WG]MCX9146452.1 hypothetical protein [Erythrobacter sp. WG]
MMIVSDIRLRAAALLTGLALVLSGCFMTPGRFTAELAITGPDSFTFRYDGEIFFLGLSKLAQMGAAADQVFKPQACYEDESFEERACTEDELAKQRADWDAGAEQRAAEAKKQGEQMAALMGGIDPSNPKAAEELVRLLQRQKGWERVVAKSDGVFDVSYRASGTLGHDFTFPAIEGFPPINPFVQLFLRKGGQVRVNAPGFAAQNGEPSGLGAMLGMGSLAGLAALGGKGESEDAETDALKAIPQIDGTFTIRSAPGMRILANNTDEGPAAAPTGETLTWTITPRTTQVPTALIAANGR